jgi:hypothetical protein
MDKKFALRNIDALFQECREIILERAMKRGGDEKQIFNALENAADTLDTSCVGHCFTLATDKMARLKELIAQHDALSTTYDCPIDELGEKFDTNRDAIAEEIVDIINYLAIGALHC